MSSVADRYNQIRERIREAAQRAGREAKSIVLVGASKRQTTERLREAFDAGLEVFGENRVQEAEDKQPALPETADWHLIGPLQSNKARRAAAIFSTVHSIDRPKIARTLDRHAGELGKPLSGLLEINLGNEPTKHGFPPTGLSAQVEPLLQLEHLQLVGLMAIPPFEPDTEAARGWFRKLRALRDEIRALPEWAAFPGWLSMGMSHDFETAIEEGATHVRVGTALFGPRP
jgi:pyridoxal phosphate enzyme (YggS family)